MYASDTGLPFDALHSRLHVVHYEAMHFARTIMQPNTFILAVSLCILLVSHTMLSMWVLAAEPRLCGSLGHGSAGDGGSVVLA